MGSNPSYWLDCCGGRLPAIESSLEREEKMDGMQTGLNQVLLPGIDMLELERVLGWIEGV